MNGEFFGGIEGLSEDFQSLLDTLRHFKPSTALDIEDAVIARANQSRHPNDLAFAAHNYVLERLSGAVIDYGVATYQARYDADNSHYNDYRAGDLRSLLCQTVWSQLVSDKMHFYVNSQQVNSPEQVRIQLASLIEDVTNNTKI
ncbi:hypothetical protein ACTXIV_13155 [Psychrobacter celer]|uniref:hypothetical protein n=1 Tax=Psychrobacter celer TaxID=306572 RepID=UPI0030DBD184